MTRSGERGFEEVRFRSHVPMARLETRKSWTLAAKGEGSIGDHTGRGGISFRKKTGLSDNGVLSGEEGEAQATLTARLEENMLAQVVVQFC